GMSFVINDINPSFTMGDVERRRREILMRLDAEGVLEQNRSLEWNVPSLRIAVVSAQGAAGYGDFINQLYSNTSSIKFVTRLFPAVLQGEKTASSVIAALDSINEDIDNWDCVVIIRGGGATSDLVSFDNYDLAANVAQFPIPVVVGIGHERDVTVLDYIANVRVKTPTAAAEMLIVRAEELISGLRETASDMLLAVNEKISGCSTQLAYLEAQLPVAPVNAVERKKLRLDTVRSSLYALTTGRIAPQLQQLDKMPQNISLALNNLMARKHDKLAASESLLQALSPMATLKRGYTITRVGGKSVTSLKEIKQGYTLETIFSDGKIKSIITE
ncbi:MAG: exodeoxyribonuclease VII large subunit, partial [Paramuribaculum sp.]|nr:exodeoxyribonuclease VII large subunit [Paramuribaculum sp.]